jgi:predicted RNase H-like HicB family nuclease
MVINADRKPLEYYFALKYPVTIIPDVTGGFVAEIKDLPGCYSQGETLEETYQNIEEARRLWTESMYEDGNEIPLPETEIEKKYSGRFNVRIPRSLHRKLDEMAEKEGVSLNHLLVSTLSRAVGQEESQPSRARKAKSTKQSVNYLTFR